MLKTFIEASLKLSKVKNLIIEEKNKVWKPRPQMNILFVSAFGTKKSSTYMEITEKYPDEFIILDDYTGPSLQGSIDKQGRFIKGTLFTLAGKTMIIDEFFDIPLKSKRALLNLIENQRFTRTLGFSMLHPFHSKGKLYSYHGKENKIWGHVRFTTFAGAMFFSIKEDKDKALLSRFNPIFAKPTIEEILKMGKGDFSFDIEYNPRYYETITVPYDIYKEYYEEIETYVRTGTIKIPERDTGFFLRANSDIVRLGISEYIKDKTEKNIIVDNSKHLIKAIKFFPIELLFMRATQLSMTELTFLKLHLDGYSNKDASQEMNISEVHASRIKKNLEQTGFL